ncbi:MAG: ribose 5-phosphate isomerase B [Bacteroidetes bacterium]|nr:ribose 5-phosphate isomerase B [Bacteroidota bacterium]MBK9302310.1 ribose 5-phosphate isomerase B [Bacteroidota bacterium]MBK9480429.1 ribose 5-phosphate isomerase B [Bacteroidota bacterium]HQW45425.1 ribose 5-phosphate isomerase B [Chitinophagaceae bacterium]
MQKISIGCDHAGVVHREAIISHLTEKGYEITDYGTNTTASMDYPDIAHPVASDVENKQSSFGILICGSANGVSITANKHQGVRAALCWKDEIAALARQHNDANIICLPARFITIAEAILFTDTFLKTNFEGGRHQNRVDKISC